jgi:hypothetical protein
MSAIQEKHLGKREAEKKSFLLRTASDSKSHMAGKTAGASISEGLPAEPS